MKQHLFFCSDCGVIVANGTEDAPCRIVRPTEYDPDLHGNDSTVFDGAVHLSPCPGRLQYIVRMDW